MVNIRRVYEPRELAAKIVEKIEANPATFDMDSWIRRSDYDDPARDSITPDEAPNECDTTLCAAGWAVHLSGYDIAYGGPVLSREEREELNIAPDSYGQDSWVCLGAALLGISRSSAWHIFATTEEDALHHLRSIANGGNHCLSS